MREQPVYLPTVKTNVNGMRKSVINSAIRKELTAKTPHIHNVMHTIEYIAHDMGVAPGVWDYYETVLRCLFYGFHQALKFPVGAISVPSARTPFGKLKVMYHIVNGMKFALKQQDYAKSKGHAN